MSVWKIRWRVVAVPVAFFVGLTTLLAIPVSRAALATAANPRNCPTPAPTVTLENDRTDWGARINGADAKLGHAAGTIQANGGGVIDTGIVLHPCHTLSFGPGTWTNTVGRFAPPNCVGGGCQAILLFDHTAVQGAGMDRTIIMETPLADGHDNTQTAFVIEPYVEGTGISRSGADRTVTDITLHDFQISGVGVSRPANVSQQTINLGFLTHGAVYNVELNRTHSIGLQVGGSNCPQSGCAPLFFAQDVTIANNVFIGVGGGRGKNRDGSCCPGGGGVTLAVISGKNIAIQGNKFYDALGNAVIDIEPNTQNDDVVNLVIDHNLIDQSGSRLGNPNQEYYVYAIVSHVFSNQMSFTATNNTIIGTHYDAGGGQIMVGGAITNGINTNYVCSGCDARNWDIENNVIKYIGGCGICLFARDSTVKRNTIVMQGDNLLIVGSHNVLQDNVIKENSSEGAFGYTGIEEQYGSDYNKTSSNQTVGVCYWIDAKSGKDVMHCNGGRGNPPREPVHLVGAHSTSTGNKLIPRPAWPF